MKLALSRRRVRACLLFLSALTAFANLIQEVTPCVDLCPQTEIPNPLDHIIKLIFIHHSRSRDADEDVRLDDTRFGSSSVWLSRISAELQGSTAACHTQNHFASGLSHPE
jgi:hypothetical protein